MAAIAVKPGAGRDETYWAAALDALPPLTVSLTGNSLLMLVPHPDDEVLACGGLLQRLSRSGACIDIWMVTDGEACFGDHVDVLQVAAQRRLEADEAHQRLGIAGSVHWLGFPDKEVAMHTQELTNVLETHLRLQQSISTLRDKQAADLPTTGGGVVLLAPRLMDGHPDHNCIGEVARRVAAQHKLLLLQYPMWMWHSGSINELQANNVVRVELSESEKIRKSEAIAAFQSQTQPVHGPAVLSRLLLRHFRRSFEVLFVEDFRGSADSPAQC